jgi:SAM-dependent methyltransferase
MKFFPRHADRFKLASYFFSSIRKRGIWRTVQIAFFEMYYDLKFGIDTGIVIPTSQLDGEPEALRHASDYFPSSYLVLKEAFSPGHVECRGAVFIEFGCGLGRALLFASELPLRRLIGIELSSSLCVAARENMFRFYRRANKTQPEWSIVNSDARIAYIPDDATIFYFFNPFDAEVFRAVINRIFASIHRAPRDCTIVYSNPVHEAEIFTSTPMKLQKRSADYAIYHLSAIDFSVKGSNVVAPMTL